MACHKCRDSFLEKLCKEENKEPTHGEEKETKIDKGRNKDDAEGRWKV
jgi:hypothetical protein